MINGDSSFLQEYQFNDFPYQINNNFYIFEVSLINYDGRLKVLNPQIIKELVIEDDLTEIFHKGYIILDNKYDSIERTPIIQQKDLLSDNLKDFFMKGDCRDVLRVTVLPKVIPGPAATYDDVVLQSFLLDFEFAVYHEEDVRDENVDSKTKKLYFWDLNYEILREKNSYYATSNSIPDPSVILLSNSDRSITTGAAISGALLEALPATEGYKINISKDFDPGATTIFFSAPAQYKAIDTINYILYRHVSSADNKFDPCILRFERYPREFSLISLADYFKGAVQGQGQNAIPGKYFLEDYKIVGFDNIPTEQNQNISFTLSKGFSPTYAPYFNTIGNINTYSFDNMSGQFTQDELVPKVVNFYGYGDKIFEIDSERNSTTSNFNAIKDNYCALGGDKTSSKIQNILPGDYRNKNKNIRYAFASVETSSDQRLSLGRTKFLYDYILNSNLFIFKVTGSTHRQAGRFISISRDTSIPLSDFDKKILGIYLIVNVKHNFQNAVYTNELVCVKAYLEDNVFLNPTHI